MRTMMLALAATSMTLPAAAVIAPTEASAKQSRYYSGRTWYDNQGRVRCKRPNGTTGLLVGGVGGALVGRAIDTEGSRATGTIIGAAAGALIGRSIDRNRTRNQYVCR
jgi:outer membrane lipoprotein SlyB